MCIEEYYILKVPSLSKWGGLSLKEIEIPKLYILIFL